MPVKEGSKCATFIEPLDTEKPSVETIQHEALLPSHLLTESNEDDDSLFGEVVFKAHEEGDFYFDPTPADCPLLPNAMYDIKDFVSFDKKAMTKVLDPFDATINANEEEAKQGEDEVLKSNKQDTVVYKKGANIQRTSTLGCSQKRVKGEPRIAPDLLLKWPTASHNSTAGKPPRGPTDLQRAGFAFDMDLRRFRRRDVKEMASKITSDVVRAQRYRSSRMSSEAITLSKSTGSKLKKVKSSSALNELGTAAKPSPAPLTSVGATGRGRIRWTI